MDNKNLIEQASFDVCEKEPLANSGLIQANGALLFIDKKSGEITFGSENVGDWLGEDLHDLLGTDGVEWLETNIPDAPSLPAAAGKRVQLPNALDMGFGELDLQVSATSGGWILEFERSNAQAVNTAVELIKPSGKTDEAFIEALQQSLVEAIARVSGYDRVMLYKFSSDWSGEVLAETVTEQEGEYLGLRFPATDIPSIARSLYAKLPYRHIPDATTPPVQILGLAGSGERMDLTWSDLRSVSPFHVTYLNNMSVRSSFSVSIMLEGRLWGLIACHHHDALEIPLSARVRCKELADEYVQSLAAYRTSIQRNLYERVNDALAPLEQNGSEPGLDLLTTRLPHLCELLDTSSAALVVDGSVLGATPSVDTEGLLRLHDWCLHNTTGEVVFIDNLPVMMKENLPQNTAGVMALNFRAKQHGNAAAAVYLLRPEETTEIAWAGNQDQLQEAAASGQLSPRSSFEKWIEVRRGYSRAWDENTHFTGAQVREKLANVL